jgi:hypothetical protein
VVRRLAGRGGEETLLLLAAASSVGVLRRTVAPFFSVLAPWWRAGVVRVVMLLRVSQDKEFLSGGCGGMFRHPVSESMG